MDVSLFKKLFNNVSLAVIVCRIQENWPVVYMNPRAGLLFAPTYSVDQIRNQEQLELMSLLNFQARESAEVFMDTAGGMGHVDNYRCEILSFDQQVLEVSIAGQQVSLTDGDYFVLYVITGDSGDNAYGLSTLINTALLHNDPDEAINAILALAGESFRASRAYVFEETSATMTRNTYEWCAPGVESAIEDLQNLAKADYNYDVIIQSGMFVSNDVSTLTDGDREILEMQGIKAVAIVTFYDNGRPVGYLGFDDCETTRVWSHQEVQYLKSVSVLVSMLISRRKAEENTRSTLEVLQIISDNSEELTYVNRLDDYSLVFVNRALAETFGKTQEELIGQPCYKVLHQGQAGPCDFCPIPKIRRQPGAARSETLVWELVNDITGRTYIAKDNILKWVDGSHCHIETAVDISERVAYEDRLRYFASTDAMTGVENREWGAMVLGDKLKAGDGGSLCFIDVDGLKYTNDTYGHAMGDQLLKQVVEFLRKDTPAGAYICRWGGDEFLLWVDLPEAEAEDLLQQVQGQMDSYNKTGQKAYSLSISYGIVDFTAERGNTFDKLVTAADQRMYDNKMTKRGNSLRRRRGEQDGE